jgi:apolipoprotein N-acyltransferase
VLLWAAFFPLDLGFLGFVALVPWLSLVRADVSRRRRYLAAYVGGFVFSALATQWVRVAHPMMYFSWLAFSLVLPLFWVLALDFIRRLDRRWRCRSRGSRSNTRGCTFPRDSRSSSRSGCTR